MKRLRHSFAAIWLGLLALVASGLEQNQLNASILWAGIGESSAQSTTSVPVDHTTSTASHAQMAMPADCPMHNMGGHTHRGHSDCALCGAQGALAAFTHSAPIISITQIAAYTTVQFDQDRSRAVGTRTASYNPRAPPLA